MKKCPPGHFTRNSPNLENLYFQVSRGTNEEKIVGCECRGNGAKSQQSARTSFLHVRPLLGAIFPLEYILRCLPRVLGTGTRGRHVPLAWLRVLHYQSGDLHHLQQNVQGCVRQIAEVQVFRVSGSYFAIISGNRSGGSRINSNAGGKNLIWSSIDSREDINATDSS